MLLRVYGYEKLKITGLLIIESIFAPLRLAEEKGIRRYYRNCFLDGVGQIFGVVKVLCGGNNSNFLHKIFMQGTFAEICLWSKDRYRSGG